MREREFDCHDLVAACHQEQEENEQFQFCVLTYAEYQEMDYATDFGHEPSDLMAIIWMEPGQHAVSLAHGYSISWDASHDTNWLRLKYFDFAVLGDYDLLATIAQGLQRHEDTPTNMWILRSLREMLGADAPCKVVFITSHTTHSSGSLMTLSAALLGHLLLRHASLGRSQHWDRILQSQHGDG
jgi:hypothetical protein